MADIKAIIEDFRLRAEIAVGSTVAVPRYQQQIDWLQQQFISKFDVSTGGDGSKATATSIEGSSLSLIYPGATDQECATAIRFLIRDLQTKLAGVTQSPESRGMRWFGRRCES